MRYFLSLFLLLLACCQSAYAFSWQDLWLRKDQQAANAFQHGKLQRAAKLFTSSDWQGAAMYRSGDYQQALQAFEENQTARNFYNRGNTLAQLGEFKQAIKSYEKALALQTNYPDADYNIEVLKKVLQKKPPQKKQQQQSQKQQPSKKQKKNNQQQKSQRDKQGQQQQSQSEKQKQQQQSKNEKQKKHDGENNPQSSETKQYDQATEQWLRRIPEQPGGLLRHKFLRDHQRYSNQAQGAR